MRMTLAILALTVAIGAAAEPATSALTQDRKGIIVIADTATWEEYTSAAAPFVRRWLRECAVGIMNTRVQDLATPPAAYLTLGAGSRAAAELDPELAEFALGARERYGASTGADLFSARLGRRLPAGGIGYLGLPSVARENAAAMYPLRLGLLGGALRRAGLTAAAVGNADLLDRYRRQIVTMVMDETGIVPVGDVGPRMTHLPVPWAAPVIRTDYDALEVALDGALAHASVVAVETGDLSRITEESQLVSPEIAQRERSAAIARIDRFISRLAGRMKGRPWRLYLVTPSALSEPGKAQGLLTPLAVWGAGMTGGLLTSPSTRRAGIVANTDFAPSLLEFLEVPIPPEALGRPMTVAAARVADAVEYVKRLQSEQERAEALRPGFLKTANALIIAAFVIAAAVLILAGPVPPGVSTGLRETALLIMAFPLAVLVVPGSGGLAFVIIAIIAVMLAAYAGAHALGRWAPPWAWLASAFALVLYADVAFGQNLVQHSLLSYSVVVGARYYGMGNELGGVLLAAAPLAVVGSLSGRGGGRYGRPVAVALLALGVVAIGHPAMGANFGIAMPAALGFGITAIRLYRPRLTLRHLLIALVVAGLAGLLIAVGNWMGAAQGRSHIGEAVAAIRRGGIGEMITIFARRAAFNWLLVRHSIATSLLVSALVVLAGATLGRTRALAEETDADPRFAAGLIGACVGAVIAFVLNDSGVLASAWGFAMIAAVVVYVVFDWRIRQGAVRAG